MRATARQAAIYLMALLLTVEAIVGLELTRQNKAQKAEQLQQKLIDEIKGLEARNSLQKKAIIDLGYTIGTLNSEMITLREQLDRKADKSDRSGEPRPEISNLGTYTVTAYCPCSICCGAWAKNRPGGIVTGAAGVELTEGISVASPLPLGTEILIDGHKYTVHDRTAKRIAKKYEDRIIDIYMADHAAAWKFGKQQLEVQMLN